MWTCVCFVLNDSETLPVIFTILLKKKKKVGLAKFPEL